MKTNIMCIFFFAALLVPRLTAGFQELPFSDDVVSVETQIFERTEAPAGDDLAVTNLPKKRTPLQRKTGKAPDRKFSVVRSIGSIIVIIGGLLFLSAWLRKRQAIVPGRDTEKKIKLIEKCSIDHRRNLLLVEVEGKRILLGVGADRIESLAVLSEKNAPANDMEGESE